MKFWQQFDGLARILFGGIAGRGSSDDGGGRMLNVQYSGRKSVEIGRAEVMVAWLSQRIFSDDIMRSNYHMESQL